MAAHTFFKFPENPPISLFFAPKFLSAWPLPARCGVLAAVRRLPTARRGSAPSLRLNLIPGP